MTKNFDKALEFLLKSLEIREKYLNENNIILGIYYQHIGGTYINELIFDKPLEYYNKAIQIFYKHLNDQNQYEKSTEYFIKTIKIMENNSFSDNLICFLSDCYQGIAFNYYKTLEYHLSITFYGKCLEFLLEHIKLSVLCDHRNDISSCLINLSLVYIENKN